MHHKIFEGGIDMFGLTPFNRNGLQNNNGVTDFYNAIDDFFNNSFMPLRDLRNDTFKVDIKEIEGAYLIEAEMPGIKKEDIQIDYHNESLIIGVKRQEEVNEEQPNYIHRERHMTAMSRSIYLKDINEQAIEAKLEEGMLKIVVPKQTEAKPLRHRITIQ